MTKTLDQRLRIRGDVGVFDEAEVAGSDAPVRRYFRAAIAPGTHCPRAARLRIRGSIKFGNRWVGFRADELLAPLHGYDWPARFAGGLLRGSDTYVDGDASMRWKLLGLVPVVRASGRDVARSAMGRGVAEGIWLPTALLPRYGVVWHAENDEQLVAEIPIGDERVTLQVNIDSDGHVRSDHLDRWNAPTAQEHSGGTRSVSRPAHRARFHAASRCRPTGAAAGSREPTAGTKASSCTTRSPSSY